MNAKDWKRVPFHTLFRRVTKRTGYGDKQLLSVYRDYGVIIKSDRDDNFNRTGESLDDYQLVTPGDLVLNKMKTWQGSLGVSAHEGIVSPAYFVYEPQGEFDNRYMHHLLRAQNSIDYYGAHSKGIRVNQWDLQPEYLDKMKVWFPPLSTQQRIADYLDRETAEIDAAVADLDRYVELLEKRRLAILARTFPDPSCEMESRSTEFADWNVRPLWSMFSREKVLGFVSEPIVSVFRDRGVVYKDDHENLNQTAEDRSIYQLIQAGWLVVNRMKAWQGSVGVSKIRGITSGHYICFRPSHDQNHRFMNELLRSPGYTAWYWKHSRGVRPGQAEIDNQWLNMLPILFPSVEAQQRIVDHLDRETAEIDSLIAESTKLRDLLLKRRSVLITEVVTGRKQV